MKFETLLARRYILSQKRHTLLTICSIVIAVALMVILFSAFTTIMGISRAALYDQNPYHVMFFDVTREQAAQIRHMNQVGSAEIKANPDGGNSVQVQVIFDTYIDNEVEFVQAMIDNLHLKASFTDYGGMNGFDINRSLMATDQVNLTGRYNTACLFSLFFIFVIFFALALRLVIDTAFEVSSKERERQFGVLQSIGATPKQIVRILTVEGMLLSGIGVPLGTGIGLLLTLILYKTILSTGVAEAMLEPEKISQIVQLHIKPWMTLIAALVGVAWVFFSAYGTGMRIIKKSPVQAITARANTVKKVKKHTMLSLLFGWTGKVASRNARRNYKRFIVTVLSLTISLTLFASTSTILRQMEESIQDIFVPYDEFGPYMYDFELNVTLEPEKPVQHPASFGECIKMLEDTGYFKNIDHRVCKRGTIHDDGNESDNQLPVHVYYVGRFTYDRIFDHNPEISYDELTKSGSGILLNAKSHGLSSDMKELKLDIERMEEITEEEYRKRYEAGKEQLLKEDPNFKFPENRPSMDVEVKSNAYSIRADLDDYNNLEGSVFYEKLDDSIVYQIAGTYVQKERNSLTEESFTPSGMLMLILTEDTWLSGDWKKFGTVDNSSWNIINCELVSDEVYSEAKRYLMEHKDIFGFGISEDEGFGSMDLYGEMKKIRTALAAERIGMMFLLALIALIAIVNMVNIVSTGIINRKSELASMQCVGMTRGQLYRLTAIECLQFTLWAAIASTLLTIVLGFGTFKMMDLMGVLGEEKVLFKMIISAVAKLWIGSVLAFFCALAASLTPLHIMQKEELVEQIRAVE